MKTILMIIMATLLAFTSISSETQQECTKKATDKLTAAKHSCAELNKKK